MLKNLAKVLRKQREALATLMHEEMGKNKEDGIAEIEKCAACADFYADLGPQFLEDREIKTEAARSFVTFEPLGTVLAIMPWNFPFWQAFRCAIPALLAGNTVVLKHASNVTGCALAAEKIFQEASDENGLFQVVVIPGDAALDLIGRPEISAVSFTGSTDVGRKIAAVAGVMLKKCVLELGGSDAYLILADANLDHAVKACVKSRLINSGQSCISAKRFIVEAKVRELFEQKMLAEMKSMQISPLARADLRKDLQKQVEKSVNRGAKILCGGKIPEGPGYHYPPTILTGVKPGMEAFDEETFGPVAAITEAVDAEDALRLGNLSSFGLGAAVFTRNIEQGIEYASREMEAGSCFVNDFVRSDPRLPFGGIKDSGFGRELSEFGLLEFVNVKTVYAAGQP